MEMDLGIEDMSITEGQQEELQRNGLLESDSQFEDNGQNEEDERDDEIKRQEIQDYLDSQNKEVVDEYVKVQATDYAGKLEEISNKLDSINVHDPSVRDEVKEQLLNMREELTEDEEVEEEKDEGRNL